MAKSRALLSHNSNPTVLINKWVQLGCIHKLTPPLTKPIMVKEDRFQEILRVCLHQKTIELTIIKGKMQLPQVRRQAVRIRIKTSKQLTITSNRTT